MHAFILAGGFATRLWPLTERRAKPLLPLLGKPLITHMLEKIPADVPVTVSTNAAFESDFVAWKETTKRPNVFVHVEPVLHDDQKLGALRATADWIERETITDDVLLLTGDNYFGFDVSTFLKSATPDVPLIAVYDIKDREQAKLFGTVILSEDKKTIAAFEEKPKEPRSTLVSTGCSLLPASVLPILTAYAKDHPDNVGGIFEHLLQTGKRVDSFVFSEPWFDIGTFEAYLEATQTLVGEKLLQAETARWEESQSHGSVVVGEKTDVIRSTLTNTVLFDGCFVEDCILENCIVDNHCTLRGVELTGKMIRGDTTLVLPVS
jgi:glucose-1-phosphate thymidylyltransferase